MSTYSEHVSNCRHFFLFASLLAACSHVVPRSLVLSKTDYPGVVSWISATDLRAIGYAGKGVRVGIISYSGMTNYENLKRAGILPNDIVIFEGEKNKGDEADWMLQVVHQIAPAAKLAVCEYSKLGLVGCARLLIRKFHADVIVTDVIRRTTSFMYPSAAVKLEVIHEAHPEVLFLAAAGNGAGNFYRGSWHPVSWSLNGTQVLAQDFGISTRQSSRPYNIVRIQNDLSLLRIEGHVHVKGTPSAVCPNLPLRLVLLDRHDRVIASTRVKKRGENCGRLYLAVLASEHPVLATDTIYHVALVAPTSLKHANFRIRLHGSAVSRKKSNQHDGLKYVTELFRWRYAVTGTAGVTVGPARETGWLSVTSVNPYTAFQGRYVREAHAAAGPGRFLPSAGQHLGEEKLFCYRQPRLAVPDRVLVAYPWRNSSSYRYLPFVGTSAAAPVVGGAVALLLSAGIAPQRIPELLKATATKEPGKHGWTAFYGYGVINVDAAARAATLLPQSSRDDISPMPGGYGTYTPRKARSCEQV